MKKMETKKSYKINIYWRVNRKYVRDKTNNLEIRMLLSKSRVTA